MAFTVKRGAVTFEMFFDRAEVLKQLEKKEARVLNRTGGEGRQIVKRSMRPGGKGGKTSEPGQPPRYQTKILRDAIYYGYDNNTRTVVIGPLKKRTRYDKTLQVLEQGGKVNNAIIRVRDTAPQKGSKKRRYKFIRKNITIRPRPFVGPTSVNHPIILDALRKNIERYQLL